MSDWMTEDERFIEAMITTFEGSANGCAVAWQGFDFQQPAHADVSDQGYPSCYLRWRLEYQSAGKERFHANNPSRVFIVRLFIYVQGGSGLGRAREVRFSLSSLLSGTSEGYRFSAFAPFSAEAEGTFDGYGLSVTVGKD